jgi:hypothetical protein
MLEHEEHLKTRKGSSSRTLCQTTRKLQGLNRNQLRHVTGLLTGHTLLKGHLHLKVGPVNNPLCERCHNKEHAALHVKPELNQDFAT